MLVGLAVVCFFTVLAHAVFIEAPVQLIYPDDNHTKLLVNESSLNILRSIKQSVVVVASM